MLGWRRKELLRLSNDVGLTLHNSNRLFLPAKFEKEGRKAVGLQPAGEAAGKPVVKMAPSNLRPPEGTSLAGANRGWQAVRAGAGGIEKGGAAWKT